MQNIAAKARILFILLLLLISIPFMDGCNKAAQQQTAASQKTVITDLIGRSVEISAPTSRVVAIGPGALRLVCYISGSAKVVGVENIEKQESSTGRTYIMAYPELKDLPVIGQGGPDVAPDAEKLIAVKPDVIFTTYAADKAQVDELQANTGIPVVVLSYGKVAAFDENVNQSLYLIGKILGEERRAQEVVEYIKDCQQDLRERTKDVPNENKPVVYVGALGAKGGHGIESTQAGYSPFTAVNARNVVDETNKKGSVMIEKEKLLDWDPDMIFLDENNYQLVQQDYQKNPQFYQSLKAVKNDQVYGQLPYNNYTTNIDTAIADAYWAGKVIFPDQYKDVDPVKKADEIYKVFLGKPMYKSMAEIYGGFKKLDLNNP